MSDARERRVVIGDGRDDARADVALARALGLSVREARGLFDDGGVTRAGRSIAKGDRVQAGDVLDVTEPKPWLSPRDHDWLVVVHESADVVVVDKPAGVPSHPLRRGEGGTVADALAFRYPECSAASEHEREAGLVHRLDTFTSGLLAAARSREAWLALRAAFRDGNVRRAYLALVDGLLTSPLLLDAAIAHDPSDARRMVTVRAGDEAKARGEPKAARSHVTPVASSGGASLVLVRTEGGRRHQVRVHLASAGFPLVGDVLYGGSETSARAGHLLHAALLELPGEPRLVSSPPADFVTAARERGLTPDDVERAREGFAAP